MSFLKSTLTVATVVGLGFTMVNLANGDSKVAVAHNQSAAGVSLPDGYRAVTLSCW